MKSDFKSSVGSFCFLKPKENDMKLLNIVKLSVRFLSGRLATAAFKSSRVQTITIKEHSDFWVNFDFVH